MAVLLQPELVLQRAARPDLPDWIGLIKGVWEALAIGFVYQSGDRIWTRCSRAAAWTACSTPSG